VEQLIMRGKPILAVFFLMFTIASPLIPCQLFPGNFLCFLFGFSMNSYGAFLSAVFNGVVYGVILWLVFTLLSRRLEE